MRESNNSSYSYCNAANALKYRLMKSKAQLFQPAVIGLIISINVPNISWNVTRKYEFDIGYIFLIKIYVHRTRYIQMNSEYHFSFLIIIQPVSDLNLISPYSYSSF